MALCRWRGCNAEVAVAVEDGRLVQWGARTDRSRPGKLVEAPVHEVAAWGDRRQPTHTPMAPDEHEKTRSGAPRKDWRPV